MIGVGLNVYSYTRFITLIITFVANWAIRFPAVGHYLKMSEFLPLRTKLKRAGTGEEDNFVPPYLPETLVAARDSREDFEKVHVRVHVHSVLRVT